MMESPSERDSRDAPGCLRRGGISPAKGSCWRNGSAVIGGKSSGMTSTRLACQASIMNFHLPTVKSNRSSPSVRRPAPPERIGPPLRRDERRGKRVTALASKGDVPTRNNVAPILQMSLRGARIAGLTTNPVQSNVHLAITNTTGTRFCIQKHERHFRLRVPLTRL